MEKTDKIEVVGKEESVETSFLVQKGQKAETSEQDYLRQSWQDIDLY